MPQTVSLSYAGARTALSLLSNVTPHAAETVGKSGVGAALFYAGSQDIDPSAAAYTIDTILRTRLSPPGQQVFTSAEGLANFQFAADRFAQAGIELNIVIDGKLVGHEAANRLGDRSAYFIAQHAASLAVTPEESLHLFGDMVAILSNAMKYRASPIRLILMAASRSCQQKITASNCKRP